LAISARTVAGLVATKDNPSIRTRLTAMQRLVSIAVLLTLTAACGTARAEMKQVRACDFEVKRRCVTGDASVTLVNGVVTKVEVNVFWCGPRGKPGYSCTIDSTREEDREAKWSEEGGATIVANTSPFNPDSPDRAKLTVGKHVSIDLEEAQSLGRCGVGAELPRAIVIPAQGKTCRVWLGAQ
jgi:hypothetical protein